jgi:hypothetical protein
VLQTQIRDTLQRERPMASLAGFFGRIAVLLTASGLYGLISYMTLGRRNEIGIRKAPREPIACAFAVDHARGR